MDFDEDFLDAEFRRDVGFDADETFDAVLAVERPFCVYLGDIVIFNVCKGVI